MAQNITKGVKDLLADAGKSVTDISVDEASKLYDQDNYVFIDIRDSKELAKGGKIPGATWCARGMIEFAIDPSSPAHNDIFNQDKTYVFYCASGGRSALAAQQAMTMGLDPVLNMAGGFGAWKKADAPVEDA